MAQIIEHNLGAFSTETLQQCCVLCGKVIVDYNNGLTLDGSFPKWPEGQFYEEGVNPTCMFLISMRVKRQYLA